MIYVLVHYWGGQALGPPVLIEDFYMAMRDEDTRIVEDAEGYGTTESGKRVRLWSAKYVEDPADPLVRETVKVDVPAQIRENIEARWERAQANGETGDKTWPLKTRPKLVTSDPAGILARTDVKAMKGKDYEVLSVSP